MATSRLANILQQEYKTKGLIGGAASAVSGRLKEKLDIRNALFSGGGIGSILGTKIFGKGYSATRKNGASASTSPDALGSGSSSILQDINTNGKITAKNSMALPSMAKQMNIMQKNIAKLVTIWGGKPTSKADSFFSNAKFRENQYESQFKAGDKQPTKVEGKEKSGGGILSMLGGLVGPIIAIISAIGTKIVTGVGDLMKKIKPLITFFGALGSVVMVISKIFRKIIGFFIKSPLGRLLGLAAVAVGIDKLFDDSDADGGDVGGDTGGESKKTSLGEKIAYTGVAAYGAKVGVDTIKENLSKRKPEVPKKPGFLMSAEEKIAENAAKKGAAQSKWGRFLIWLERRAPRLFARIGLKLATMGGLAAVPVAGWVVAIVSFGFLIWDAYYVYELWTEYNNSPESKDSQSNESTKPSAYIIDQNVTVPPKPTQVPVAPPAGGSKGFGETGGGAATGMPNRTPSAKGSQDSSRKQIEAYLGKAISDEQYDTFLKAVGAEAGKDPMERAAVASVILNRAKKLGGSGEDILKVLNAPFQFQAITGPDGKSGDTNNPWSPNAKKLVPGIDRQVADNISLVPKGLDSFTSAVPSAYGAVGGKAKYDKKMAEMAAHGGQTIGQSVFANMGVNPNQTAGTKINGGAIASASMSQADLHNAYMDEMSIRDNELAEVFRSTPMYGGQNSGSTQIASLVKATPYEREFYKNLVATVAL